MRGGPPAPDRGLSTRSVSCSSVSRARRSFRWSLEDRFHRIPAQDGVKVGVRVGFFWGWCRAGSLDLFTKIFLKNYVCVHAWVYHKHMSTGTRGVERKASACLELELTCSYGLPAVSPGNRTWVPWKSSEQSYLPGHSLSS